MSAVDVLRAGGNVRPEDTIRAAQLEGIDLAVAATMLNKESNGRNVWGGDAVSTGGVYTKGAEVTKSAYLTYKNLASAKKIGRQGVGPAQCTSAFYQNQADAIGAPDGLGCWDPVTNMRSGFRGLQGLIRAYGLRDGARRYNGSGPMAERYADDFMSKYATWKARLAGATIPYMSAHQEEDMANQTLVVGNLPAGQGNQIPILVPVFDPNKVATLWLTTGWSSAHFRNVAFVVDKGPGLTPEQEGWGGLGEWDLVHDDRPPFILPKGCTSILFDYDSDHSIAFAIVAPPI
jgi:hypothetical protein